MKIFLLLVAIVLSCTMLAQPVQPWCSVFYNSEQILPDTLKEAVENFVIEIKTLDDQQFLTVHVFSDRKDSIEVVLSETDYYPDKISCLLNDTMVNDDTLRFTRDRFKGYQLELINEPGHGLALKIEYKRKKFVFEYFLIVPLVRHIFPKTHNVELVETSR